ncbi:hypothetical protein PSMK_06970 [Phycisphaera mikurensis NBRC 102666]|uniref:Uncharacterized protein n=2 Tax=Phycisphaera TaxID=666508 RepID=I0IC68_PHYMF|nr:hypothetical protein PSMK_06970 [Phycisphaera mikurensis NBRC 102666]
MGSVLEVVEPLTVAGHAADDLKIGRLLHVEGVRIEGEDPETAERVWINTERGRRLTFGRAELEHRARVLRVEELGVVELEPVAEPAERAGRRSRAVAQRRKLARRREAIHRLALAVEELGRGRRARAGRVGAAAAGQPTQAVPFLHPATPAHRVLGIHWQTAEADWNAALTEEVDVVHVHADPDPAAREKVLQRARDVKEAMRARGMHRVDPVVVGPLGDESDLLFTACLAAGIAVSGDDHGGYTRTVAGAVRKRGAAGAFRIDLR